MIFRQLRNNFKFKKIHNKQIMFKLLSITDDAFKTINNFVSLTFLIRILFLCNQQAQNALFWAAIKIILKYFKSGIYILIVLKYFTSIVT